MYFIFDIIISFLCVVVFFCMWVIYGIFFYHCYNGDYMFVFYFMFVFGDKDRDYIIIDIVIFGIMCLFFSFYVCFGFYDNIRDSFHILFLWWCLFIIGFMWYGLSLTYDNPFLFVLGYGCIILVIWGLLNYLYHRTGIYLFDFFFVCVFLVSVWGFFY